MRDPTKVPLQMAIEPANKALIRQLARASGKTMTRYLLQLVHADAKQRAALQPPRAAQHPQP